MAPKTQYGFHVSGWLSTRSDSFDVRMDWLVRVGQIWRGQNPVDKLTLQSQVTLKFVTFGYALERYVAESKRGGCHTGLHPLALPKRWYGSDRLSRQSTDGYIFLDSLSAQLEMYSAYRNEDTSKTLAFISKSLDYPDSKMSFAASDRFDAIREAWYSLDDFGRLLWTLRERGAIALEYNLGNDNYFMPAERSSQPITENVLSWLWSSDRRAKNAHAWVAVKEAQAQEQVQEQVQSA